VAEKATFVYPKQSAGARALAYFANPPTGKDRIAAVYYSTKLIQSFNVGKSPKKFTLYFAKGKAKGSADEF
jgi:hypothetical protein